MKKIIGFIILSVVLLLSINTAFSAYYHPNDDIAQYVDDVNEQLIQIEAKAKVSDTIEESHFKSLYKDFEVLKDALPQIPNYRVTYNKCYEISKVLADGFDDGEYSKFKSQCATPYKEDSKDILTSYSVQANINASPDSGNSPLTVTFDSAGSIDPSNDTIPNGNFYWYYKDAGSGQEVFIGKGAIVKHTFQTAGEYKVHLTAKSVNNKEAGILDGTASVNIEVKPAIANVVLYVNGKRAYTDRYIKISSEDAKAGVKFDAGPTTAAGATDIETSTWEIFYEGDEIYYDEVDGYPGAVTEKLLDEGAYSVNITIEDNTGKTVTRTFKFRVSDPVATIKVSPIEGNTSTKFSFDASTSYSSQGRIINYKWTITDPNGRKVNSLETKKFQESFKEPGPYTIKLEVANDLGETNSDDYKLYVDSAYPIPKFNITPHRNWEKPSAFILDATPSHDADIKNGDEISYEWSFSDREFVQVQTIQGGRKAIVQFDKEGEYEITLTVTDKFGKTADITEIIEVESVLRPEVNINPNYTVLGNPVNLKANVNKTVSYYEWDFGDGRDRTKEVQSSNVTHLYEQSGVYDLVLRAESIDGDSNSITEKVFVGQKGYPIAIYEVLKGDNEKVYVDNCKIIKNKEEVYVKAYKISRQEEFTVDASLSVNEKGQSGDRYVKTYFSIPNDDENIVERKIEYKFDELGCQKINVNVTDRATGKEDTQEIWFNVENAKPTIDNLIMFFPQYGGEQIGSASFNPTLQQDSNMPEDIFTDGIDPLLVRLDALNAFDPDGSMIKNYRWYYFNINDKNNILQAKVTPYNVPSTVFSIPKIPGEYMFGVEVCDIDGECILSTDSISDGGLGGGPVVVFPASSQNPDIPMVTVRVDNDDEEGLGEINVGDKVYINIIPKILSNRTDFKENRVIKIDFDGDGEYDMTTKKEKVEYVFREAGKYKIKAKVIYRGYGGIGYISTPLIVKNGLRPLIVTEQYDDKILYWDLSYGDIAKKELCFDMRKCRAKDVTKYKITEDSYGMMDYVLTGTYQMSFKLEDKYGNFEQERSKILVNEILTGNDTRIMFIPRAEEKEGSYMLDVGGELETSILVYVHDYNEECYIDKDISLDTSGDGNESNDHDVPCNVAVKIDYPASKQTIIGRVYYGENKKDFYVNLLDADVIISPKFEELYEEISALVLSLNDYDSDSVDYLKTLLLSLQSSLGDKIESDSLVFQLQDWLDENAGELDEETTAKVKKVIIALQDKAVAMALDQNEYFQAKEDILLLVPEELSLEIRAKFDALEAVAGDKEEVKTILQDILDLAKRGAEEGQIDDETLNIIRLDVCDILAYYEIDSQACGDTVEQVEDASKETSMLGTILKIVLYVFAFFVVAFIFLMIIFVIKARNRRKSGDDDDYEDEVIEEEIIDDYVDDGSSGNSDSTEEVSEGEKEK